MTTEQINQEELMAQLKTRGYESGGGPKTPLRDFWGTLDSITGSMEKRGNADKPRLYVIYTSSDLEVIKSTEPYLAPIAQIDIPQSNRQESGMGVFGSSIDRIVNVDENGPLPDYLLDESGQPVKDDSGSPIPNPELKDQFYLVSKRLHWVYTGGHMMWDGGQKKQVAREAWEITEISDDTPPPKVEAKAAKPSAKKSPMAVALELLEGKTEQQFYQAVFSNQICKTDSKMISSITGRKFLAPLVESGAVVMDDDKIYHVVG